MCSDSAALMCVCRQLYSVLVLMRVLTVDLLTADGEYLIHTQSSSSHCTHTVTVTSHHTHTPQLTVLCDTQTTHTEYVTHTLTCVYGVCVCVCE